MVAKLIAHGATREQALDRLASALARTVVAGPRTNLGFLAALVDAPEFRQGMAALDLELGLGVARHGVEEDRFLDRGHEGMADPAQHRVIRPDRQLEAATRLKGAHVMPQMLLRVGRLEPEAARRRMVDTPAARGDVLGRHERVRVGVPAPLVDEEEPVEDLRRLVGVE